MISMMYFFFWFHYVIYQYEMATIPTLKNGVLFSDNGNNYNENYYLFILLGVIAFLIIIFVVILIIYCCKNNAYELLDSTLNGPSPLKNIKECCYMNSMMQALASNEYLIKDLDQIIIKVKNNKIKKLILLRNLLQNINFPQNPKSCVIDNTKCLQRLTTLVQWNKDSQEDTFQLLSSFINGIQNDIKKELKKENITMPPKFKLLHTFTESSDYNKVQDHLALAIPLCGDFRNEPGVELNTLMDAFFQPSPIDDGQYSTQMFFFKRVPDVLILHIQANEWDDDQGTYIKPKYYVRYKDKMEYEFKIQLKKDGSEMMKVKEVYKLTAVVHHMGTISGGHYITYRTHEGVWYLTNDEQVEEVSFNFDKVPYVMVYKKLEKEYI